ncbi:L,D-transpeptidase [Fulvimarina sp. 2208YS6-2-32]|uniref:L,D-transpeptidase n=1 Tax=Fulvimarina uroteuthidis TaxID=3098149 RepID=A0ABU5HZ19_9HYPH|nr:L,D-transpeptidase [Fulvimarina sp. 2208YS6-2-32]MDY8108377.1 L,D-transpeptidase [Fulvimarina sp. 2208YS6-2-32]
MTSHPSRRAFLTGLGLTAGAALAGCAPSGPRARIIGMSAFDGQGGASVYDSNPASSYGAPSARYREMYDAMFDEGYRIPAINLSRVDPIYYRREVADPTGEAPGTVVVDTANKFAYVVQPGGRAMRYGVGVGRAGMEWSGRAKIQWKKKWPTWTPPAEMIARKPELAEYSAANGGMEPGIGNPLGARALYLFQNGKDTLYRLHGSPEYWTIGTNDSSGCIRFMNQDIIDLYDRVPSGSQVLVRQGGIV